MPGQQVAGEGEGVGGRLEAGEEKDPGVGHDLVVREPPRVVVGLAAIRLALRLEEQLEDVNLATGGGILSGRGNETGGKTQSQ